MLNCLVLDDEPHCVRLLEDYIAETPFLNLVLATTDAVEALTFLKREEVDVLFLDVNMPTLTGFQFLNVASPACHVIITTAYTQHAVESYNYDVSDYLVKPISYERFLKSVTKVLNKVAEAAQGPAEQAASDFIFVKTEHKGKFQKINLEDIRYIEGLLNYVSIYTRQSDKPVITYVGIGEMEAKLPKHLFVRVHRSYIVSISDIEAIDGNEVILKRPPRIPTGEKYKEALLKDFSSAMIVTPKKKKS
ncbi:LytR/AlgR family response regulator transcription factor [Tellurirhabdus rosea]|uniref:LytR/AlgR family response regulator transcription factor n=1 Tax=Tellurirhabdus rosea TaxID=2674997 RepID=UPI0022517522|nr:LytTR family DNA-binding domain-containing protein [Tellurirhabdus rosea]